MVPRRLQSALRSCRNKLARLRHQIVRQQGSPGKRARGLAAGVFVGCFPAFGLQSVLSVALASLVRGNPWLALAVTWISNPLTDVPMIWLYHQLGIRLLGPAPDPQGTLHMGLGFASRLLLGSTIVALLAAPLSGWLCWRWLRSLERRTGS